MKRKLSLEYYQYMLFTCSDDDHKASCDVVLSNLFDSESDMFDDLIESKWYQLADFTYMLSENSFNSLNEKFEDLLIVVKDEVTHLRVTWEEVCRLGNKYLTFNMDKYKYSYEAWLAYQDATNYGDNVTSTWKIIFRKYCDGKMEQIGEKVSEYV